MRKNYMLISARQAGVAASRLLVIMLSLVIVALAAVLMCIKVYRDRRPLYEFAKGLPGPRPLPLIGNLLMFAVPRKDLFRAFYNIHKQYETPCRYWMGSKLIVAIDKPEHIEAVMVSPIASHKADEYSIIADCIGYGLIQSSGPKHKMHRKLMVMPLRSQILDSHMEKFNARGEEAAELLAGMVGKGTFEVYDRIEACSMALVTELIMGVKVNSEDSENHTLVQTISRVYQSVAERIYKFWLHPHILYRMTQRYQQDQQDMAVFNNFLNKIIDKKELEQSQKTLTDEEAQNISLEWFLHLKDSDNKPIFSRKELLEELSSLFTASEDTTATVASFVLVMLAIHKDIQQRAYEEQLLVMGSDDPTLPLETRHLTDMKYLHMVIQETLRFFPIAPSLMRKLTADFKLGDLVIPKEATLLVHVYSVHMNPKIWPNPQKFEPLRFTPEEKAKRHPYSHLPFSGGLRGCIGKQFAYMAIKCFVSHIIRRYEIDTDWTVEDIALEADISVRSTNGYKIKITDRPRR